MVFPRNEEMVTRRIFDISQYRSPFASTLLSWVLRELPIVESFTALVLAFLEGPLLLVVAEERFLVTDSMW